MSYIFQSRHWSANSDKFKGAEVGIFCRLANCHVKIKNANLIFSTQEGERVLDLEPTTPLHRQIANSCSEERAITDAIYCLGEALNRDRIGCDEYLKLVRELSRKQFFLHLLIQEARAKAGLESNPMD